MRSAVLALALAACTDGAIDMHLEFPQSTSAFDLSCVSAVDVLPIPVGDAKMLDIGYRESTDMTRVPCVDLGSPKSFADVEAQLQGQIDIPLPPEGLAGVELRGRRGSCKEVPAYYEAVFYGGAMRDPSSNTLNIPVRHNISCDQTTTYTVKPVDMVALVTTKACAAMATPGTTFVGNVRPTLLSGDFAPTTFEAGPVFEPLATDGGAQLSSYSGSFSGSCVAAAWEDGNALGSSTCINAGALTACAGNAIEVPVVAYDYANMTFKSAQITGSMVIGAVWSNAAKAPVANATIALDEAASATVLFGNVGNGAFAPAANTSATDASGMFVIGADGVVGLTVSAPGHPSRHVFVGSGAEDPGTIIVTLD
jgi:hypothetical protein